MNRVDRNNITHVVFIFFCLRNDGRYYFFTHSSVYRFIAHVVVIVSVRLTLQLWRRFEPFSSFAWPIPCSCPSTASARTWWWSRRGWGRETLTFFVVVVISHARAATDIEDRLTKLTLTESAAAAWVTGWSTSPASKRKKKSSLGLLPAAQPRSKH